MKQKTLIKKYIHHRSILVKGHGEVSLVISVFNYAMIFWLFLRDLITFSRVHILWMLPCLFIVALAVQYIIGWIWEKRKLVDEENEWISVRNPVLRQIREQTSKKE